MADEDIIDYGEWNCPTSWDDLTIKQFSEIERYYSDKEKKFDAREVVHILCNKSLDEVNALPMEFTEKILEKMLFLQEKPKEQEPKNEVIVDGEKYFVNVMEKLKTGEYIAFDTALKSDPHDYASFLTILCRKQGETYDSKFEAEVFDGRREMWEKQPLMKIMPIVSFFFQLFIVSQVPTQLSLEIREGLKSIRESITSSRENGELSAFSTKRLMRKLKKLEKSLNSISPTTSNS